MWKRRGRRVTDELGARNDKEKRQETVVQKERILLENGALRAKACIDVPETHEILCPKCFIKREQNGPTSNFMPIEIFGIRTSLTFFRRARGRRRLRSISNEFNFPSASFYAPF